MNAQTFLILYYIAISQSILSAKPIEQELHAKNFRLVVNSVVKPFGDFKLIFRL
jgi:hypothetical protein